MSILHRRVKVMERLTNQGAAGIPPWDVLRMLELDELKRLAAHHNIEATHRSTLLSKLNTLRKKNG